MSSLEAEPDAGRTRRGTSFRPPINSDNVASSGRTSPASQSPISRRHFSSSMVAENSDLNISTSDARHDLIAPPANSDNVASSGRTSPASQSPISRRHSSSSMVTEISDLNEISTSDGRHDPPAPPANTVTIIVWHVVLVLIAWAILFLVTEIRDPRGRLSWMCASHHPPAITTTSPTTNTDFLATTTANVTIPTTATTTKTVESTTYVTAIVITFAPATANETLTYTSTAVRYATTTTKTNTLTTTAYATATTTETRTFTSTAITTTTTTVKATSTVTATAGTTTATTTTTAAQPTGIFDAILFVMNPLRAIQDIIAQQRIRRIATATTAAPTTATATMTAARPTPGFAAARFPRTPLRALQEGDGAQQFRHIMAMKRKMVDRAYRKEEEEEEEGEKGSSERRGPPPAHHALYTGSGGGGQVSGGSDDDDDDRGADGFVLEHDFYKRFGPPWSEFPRWHLFEYYRKLGRPMERYWRDWSEDQVGFRRWEGPSDRERAFWDAWKRANGRSGEDEEQPVGQYLGCWYERGVYWRDNRRLQAYPYGWAPEWENPLEMTGEAE